MGTTGSKLMAPGTAVVIPTYSALLHELPDYLIEANSVYGYGHTVLAQDLLQRGYISWSHSCYWVPQTLPQIYTVIACIYIGKVA